MTRDSPPELERLCAAPNESKSRTLCPERRSSCAVHAPKHPAPITTKSKVFRLIVVRKIISQFHRGSGSSPYRGHCEPRHLGTRTASGLLWSSRPGVGIRSSRAFCLEHSRLQSAGFATPKRTPASCPARLRGTYHEMRIAP